MNICKILFLVVIVSCIVFSVYVQQVVLIVIDLDIVIVIGICGLMEKLLDIKCEVNVCVEVVIVEDVGKLFVYNVVDILQCLLGVNISLFSVDEGGFDEVDCVSLCGISLSLIQILINGYIVGLVDWFVFSQGNNVGCSVSYLLLLLELVSLVEVNKFLQVKLQDGGIIGIVNIIICKLLEFFKLFIVEGFIGVVCLDLVKLIDLQYLVLFNYKNDEGIFGVMVQGFSQKCELCCEVQEILGGFFKIGVNDLVVSINLDLIGVNVLGLLGLILFEQICECKGGLVLLQFKLSDSFILGLNGFSFELKVNNYNCNFMMFGNNFVKLQVFNLGYVVKDGVLINVIYVGVLGINYVVYDMIYCELKVKLSYVIFDVDWQISDSLIVMFQVGSIKGIGEMLCQYIVEVILVGGGGVSWVIYGNGLLIDWNVGGDILFNGVISFGIWGNQQVIVEDKEKWVMFDFNQYFNDGGVLSLIDFGLCFVDYKCEVLLLEGVMLGDIWSVLKNGVMVNYFSGFVGDIGGIFLCNFWYFILGVLKDVVINNFIWLVGNDGLIGCYNYGVEWKVKEKNFVGYVQVNFRGDWWSGNVGLCYVNIKQDIDIYNVVSKVVDVDVSSLFGMWECLVFQNKCNCVLFSVNIKFDLDDLLVLCVVVLQIQILLDYLVLGVFLYGLDLNCIGGGGNLNFKLILLINLDVNLEWYFMLCGLLLVGVYYMKLKDYIVFDVVLCQLYSELINQFEIYQIFILINVDGKVIGVEVVYEQLIGEYFGINVNYIYVNGIILYIWLDGLYNLLGILKNIYNVGVYFENECFGVWVSYICCFLFLISLFGINLYYQDDFGMLLVLLSYKVIDWLSISLDGLNFNNLIYKYYQIVVILILFYSNGCQYYFNFCFKY